MDASFVIRKLVTVEDGRSFHIHKLLGITSIAHYMYRLIRWMRWGATHMMDAREENLWVWIVIHSLLSMSSLIFHVPNNRPTARPVIYGEFRAHSIIFALRSLFAMMVLIYIKHPGVSYLLRGSIVIMTMVLADKTTSYYQSPVKTMRGMPYPETWGGLVKGIFKYYYAVSQVFATVRVIYCNSSLPYSVGELFLVLFPIQSAAFLMTLVKKSIISPTTWHILYGIALGLNYIYHSQLPSIAHAEFPTLVATLGFCYVRLGLVDTISKYVLWTFIIMIGLRTQNILHVMY